MKISEIRIKGIHNIVDKSYKFSNITYLYGLNGSGKSTILQAIQFCLLGYIPGTNKTSSAIFSHCNCNKMSVNLVLGNDGMLETEQITIKRSLYKDGSKLIEKVEIDPEGYDIESLIGNLELPIFDLNEFFRLTANKQKELLISIIPNDFDAINTKDYLQNLPQYSPMCKDIIYQCIETNRILSSIEDIKQLNAKLKEIQSGLKAEEKRLTSVTQSLIYYDDYDGCSDVSQLQSELNECLKKRDEVLKYEQKKASYESNLEKLSQYDDLVDIVEEDSRYIELNKQSTELEYKFADYFSEQAVIEEKIGTLTSELRKLQPIVDSKGICPYTETNCSSIASQMFKFTKQAENIINNINIMEKGLDEIKMKKAQANSDKFNIEKELAELIKRYETRDNLKVLCNLDDLGEFDETSAELSIKLQEINDNLVKASANEKYNSLLGMLQKQKLELNTQVEFIKAAIKATGENGLQSILSSKPFENVKLAMELSLNSLGIDNLGKPGFILEEKSNSFNLGIYREDVFIPFEQLSSGEQCLFVLIFLEALLAASNSQIHFLMIDDLFDHLDSVKFKTVIENIRKIHGIQFIIAGVNEVCKEGITTINVGEEV